MYVGSALVVLLVIMLMLVPFVRKRTRAVDRRLFLRGEGSRLASRHADGARALRPQRWPRNARTDASGWLPRSTSLAISTGGRFLVPPRGRIAGGKLRERACACRSSRSSCCCASSRHDPAASLGAEPRGQDRHDPGSGEPAWRPGRPAGSAGGSARDLSGQHALMAFEVIAVPRRASSTWLAAPRGPPGASARRRAA